MSAASPVFPSPPIPETLSVCSSPRTRSLDEVLANTSRRAAVFEMQIKALEEKLAEDLSNCRAIECSLKEAFSNIKRNYRRAEKDSLRTHVPHIDAELDQALGVLDELEIRLPAIHTQAAHVRRLYDSSRDKAQVLVEDLRWLNRDFTSRWRTVVFSRSSPVSWHWRATLRTLFALTLVLVAWGSWIALRGAYQAHRQRLVWGERLIS
ncbi:hypothetical protein EDB92DRAFT_1935502 [Lactarius akahatsu]|uniref:Uncharacterized protein n=1 Tax=Lactarius akahatsu TaxID=416441 RepID=A0AAD4Q9U4_9AGAM|nr:hypothetical protein EDB92DRAFT_1935502 [Lactarius akahatsu]